MNSLFDYVYFRDLVERHSFKNDMVLREITDVACSSVGSFSYVGVIQFLTNWDIMN